MAPHFAVSMWNAEVFVARRILLVDDEDDIREVAQISLELVGGYDVIAAASGSEAVSLAGASEPDAILLDVMMPDQDGPTIVQQLRARPETRDIPVVLLTAKTQASDHRRFADLAIQGVIAKPFDPMALPSQVADALGWES
jgi:CheY-like chemotaxis protein